MFIDMIHIIEGKGEIVRYEKFLEFPKCFLEFLWLVQASECNTSFDWLNRMVYPIRSCVAFKFTNLVLVIFANLSLFRQIFPHINHKLIK